MLPLFRADPRLALGRHSGATIASMLCSSDRARQLRAGARSSASSRSTSWRESPGYGLAGESALDAVALLLPGWALVACGLGSWLRRPESRFGVLLAVAGIAWFLAEVGRPPRRRLVPGVHPGPVPVCCLPAARGARCARSIPPAGLARASREWWCRSRTSGRCWCSGCCRRCSSTRGRTVAGRVRPTSSWWPTGADSCCRPRARRGVSLGLAWTLALTILVGRSARDAERRGSSSSPARRT